MKKYCILFYVFIFIFIYSNLFSNELWNGFTDDMTKEQVIKRAKRELSPVSVYESDEESVRDNQQRTLGERICIFSGDQESRNDKFMLPDLIIHCSSDNPSLDDKTHFDNVNFYLFDNILYGIYIRWNEDLSEEIIQQAKANYGNNYFEIIDHKPDITFLFTTIRGSTEKFLYWDFSEKEVYLKVPGNRPKTELYVISKKHYDKYKMEIEKRNKLKQKQKQEEKDKKVENIRF